MSNSTISAYFENKIKTYAAANNLQVAYESVTFVKPSTPFLECFLIPSETKNITTDGLRKRYRGLFQVNIWVPEGKGRKASDTIVDALTALFPVVPKGAVSVEQTPCAHKAITDMAGWRIVPLDIYYRLEA